MMSNPSIEELKARIAQLDWQIEQEQERHAAAMRAIQGRWQAAALAVNVPDKHLRQALTLGSESSTGDGGFGRRDNHCQP